MRPRKNGADLILGGTQLVVLQAVFRLKERAYGGGIYEALSDDDASTRLPQIYSILEKLENKGLVTHEFSSPRAVRGGRRRKVYTVTGKGHEVLRRSLVERPRLSPGEGWVLPGLGAGHAD